MSVLAGTHWTNEARAAARVRGRTRRDWLFAALGVALIAVCLIVLVVLVGQLVGQGWGPLTRDFPAFFTRFPSSRAAKAGILSPLVGTGLVMLVTCCTAIPLGVMAGVYLEEYAPKNKLTSLLEINIANLAGVPSIVWGLMALGVLIYQVERVTGVKEGLGKSVLTGGLTLAMLVLPIVIVTTREAVRAIPRGVREASFACGATKLQTVRHHTVPYAMPGILTGCIIAMSRAIGETAPLLVVGAVAYIAFLPAAPFAQVLQEDGTTKAAGLFDWLHAPFSILPMQMFGWVSRPDQAFRANAAAAGVVLLAVTLLMNTVAIVLRSRLRKGVSW